MNEKIAYIVTEGKFDAELIKRMLPELTDDTDRVGITIGAGYSSALAITESVLMQTMRPVLLVLDADTDDEMQIREKKQFVEQYVRANGTTCQVLLAVPMMDVILFADKIVMEQVMERTITDEVWTLAKLSPKKGLELLINKSREQAVQQLMSSQALRQKISQTPIMSEIGAFIQRAQQLVAA